MDRNRNAGALFKRANLAVALLTLRLARIQGIP